MTLQNARGFTLVEILISFSVALLIFLALLGGLLGIKSVGTTARHHMQAMEVARGAMEQVRGTVYDNIVDQNFVDVPYDAGRDGVFGTADDLTGDLTIQIVDILDMDGDGDSAETDGVGFFNNLVKPVRVIFMWDERYPGVTRAREVTLNTLVAR